jgi:hypothetical protein
MATAYSPLVVTDGLVMYLDAGNTKSYPGAGTAWTDISRTNNNGILTNGPTFNSVNGGSIVFDGVDDYVNIPNVYDFSISNAVTVEIWAKSTPTLWNDYGFLVSKRDQFIIHPNSGTKDVNFYVNTANGWESTGVTLTSITVFTCYTLTYSTGVISAYINASLRNSASVGATLTSDTGATTIGKDDFISRYFYGSVALTRLYNRALSQAEITQNYNATKTRFGL